MSELVEYKERGLEWKRKPETLDEMATLGEALKYFTINLPWAFADWVNMGENLFGETFSQLLPDIGRSKKTLQNWVWVGSKIPFDEREYKLDFSFYSEVARLPRESRHAMLSRAQAEGWSIAELRRQIKGNPEKKKKQMECPLCHGVFEV